MRIRRSWSVSAGDSRGLAFNILAKDREPIVTRSTKCNVPVITALHETRASVTVIPVQPRYNGRYGYTGSRCGTVYAGKEDTGRGTMHTADRVAVRVWGSKFALNPGWGSRTVL